EYNCRGSDNEERIVYKSDPPPLSRCDISLTGWEERLVLRPDDFSSNNSLYNTEKSPGRSVTLFDKEGLNFRDFITPFIKGRC
ncbi:MAG: hypothetical protein CVV49_19065, partial [Spirochaetae bacterium HGW-Spirochaetae-5]